MRRIHRIRSTLLGPLLLALLMAGAARAQDLALRADLWCPYNCEPGATEPGYLVELVRAALPQANIDYALGRWAALRRQRSAPPQPLLLLLGVSNTPASRRDLLVVEPAIGQALTCAYRGAEKKDWRLKQPSDLRGQRLSLTLGYVYHPEVHALLDEPGARRHITQMRGERASQAHARMLAMGRVDVALEDRNVMQWGLRQLDAAARAQIVEAGCLPLLPSDALHFGLPRSDPRSAQVAEALQQGLQRLQASGEIARLRQRYGLPP
jgi:polar amino acid transport system substrate-binding protein